MRLVQIGDVRVDLDQVRRVDSHSVGEPEGSKITLAGGAVVKVEWMFARIVRALQGEEESA